MYFIKAFLAVYLASSLSSADLDEGICTPIKGDGVDLPELPESYSLKFQYNLFESAETAEGMEAVDAKKGILSFEYAYSAGHFKQVTDLKNKTYVSISFSENGHVCEMGDLPTKLGDLSAVNLLNPLGIGYFLSSLKTDYEVKPMPVSGMIEVDGIFAEQYQLCHYDKSKDTTVAIDFYYSVDEWVWPREGDKGASGFKVPLKVHITTSMPNNKTPEERRKTNTVIVFSSFRASMPAAQLLQPPADSFCPGYRPEVSLPKIFHFFSYNSEIVSYNDENDNIPKVSYRRVFYNGVSNLIRVDFQELLAEDVKDTIHTSVYKSVIHDYNTGLQYDISPSMGSCHSSSINNSFSSFLMYDKKIITMPSVDQFFFFQGENTSYNGKFNERGIEADVFASSITTNGNPWIYNWYFTPNRSEIAEGKEVASSVLMKMVATPVNGGGVYYANFYNFRAEEPSINHFDITQCLNSKYFTLQFDANDHIKENPTFFKSMFQKKLIEVAEIGVLRIQVTEVEVTDKKAFLRFTLLDNPERLGNAIKFSEKDLQAAEEAIREAVEDGALYVYVRVGNNRIMKISPYPDSLKEIEEEVKTSGYSRGEMASIAVAMVFTGFFIGAIVLLIFFNRPARCRREPQSDTELILQHPENESEM